MTKEKPSARLGTSECAAKSGGSFRARPQSTTDHPKSQPLSAGQLAFLVSLARRVGDRRLQAIKDRLGFAGRVTDLSSAQAGRLIAELRRAEGRR